MATRLRFLSFLQLLLQMNWLKEEPFEAFQLTEKFSGSSSFAVYQVFLFNSSMKRNNIFSLLLVSLCSIGPQLDIELQIVITIKCVLYFKKKS